MFDHKADNFLFKLPKHISLRIYRRLEETKENPYYYFKRLKGRDEYKFRIGKYRVLAEIDDNKILIYIIHIDHRKKVYK